MGALSTLHIRKITSKRNKKAQCIIILLIQWLQLLIFELHGLN